MQVQEIRLDQIQPHPGNRTVGGFNQEKLEQLADSIRTVGVQQPAVIRQIEDDGKYELVAGERRWRAAKIAGLQTLPCVIRDLDDIEVLKIQTIENLQREDIHPLDEADGYQRLREKAGYDVELLAKDVGRSVSYIYQRLKLLELIPEARKEFVDGIIAAGHAILIARLQPKQQNEALEYCQRWNGETVSVRDLDQWIHSQILMELNKAAFKKDDSDLVTAAGSCVECPKRTGYTPALFPDISNKDLCTDPVCFNGKLDTLVEQRRQELKEKKEKFLEVCDSYGSDRPKGILEPWAWGECRKKDEGSVRCLVAAGHDRGRLTWGRKMVSSGGRVELSPEEKKKAREEKKQLRLRQEARKEVWRRTIGKIKATETDIPPELLRVMAKRLYARIWNNYQQSLCQLEGWERPSKENYKNSWERPGWEIVGLKQIENLEVSDLPIFLVKCALIEDVEVDQWNGNSRKNELLKLAKSYGIDEAAIKKEITK